MLITRKKVGFAEMWIPYYPHGPMAWRVNIKVNFGPQMNARLFGPAADTVHEGCHVHFITIGVTPSGCVAEFR